MDVHPTKIYHIIRFDPPHIYENVYPTVMALLKEANGIKTPTTKVIYQDIIPFITVSG